MSGHSTATVVVSQGSTNGFRFDRTGSLQHHN
jgi:hypothetical protein